VLRMTSTGATTFKNTTDSSSAFVIQNASATPVLTVDTTSTANGLTVRNQSGNESVTLGSELLSTWTSTTGWTGSSNTWTHTTGNTTALVNTLSSSTSSGTYYQVALTNTGGTVGNFTISLGNVTQTYDFWNTQSGGTQYFTIKATGTASALLSITPSSTFNGTVSVTSVKAITGTPYPLNPILKVADTAGSSALEVRTGGPATSNNTFIGLSSGSYNTAGFQNTGVGSGSFFGQQYFRFSKYSPRF